MSKPVLQKTVDDFLAAPLLSILPTIGDISRLESYSTAFFARYEQVRELAKKAAQDNAQEAAVYESEARMLRAVLEWLGTIKVEE